MAVTVIWLTFTPHPSQRWGHGCLTCPGAWGPALTPRIDHGGCGYCYCRERERESAGRGERSGFALQREFPQGTRVNVPKRSLSLFNYPPCTFSGLAAGWEGGDGAGGLLTLNLKAKILSDLCRKASNPSHLPSHRNLAVKEIKHPLSPCERWQAGGSVIQPHTPCSTDSHAKPLPRGRACCDPTPLQRPSFSPDLHKDRAGECLSCSVLGWAWGVKATQEPVLSRPQLTPSLLLA